MKKVYFFVVCVLLLHFNASAQDSFQGEWYMVEMTNETANEKTVLTEEKFMDEGTIWIMKFDGDTFYQKTNFNARGEMVSMDGTWKTEPQERLTIFLVIKGQKRPLQFVYKFEGDKMILERNDQLRTMRMTVVVKKAAS
jgi:hypothetical protein